MDKLPVELLEDIFNIVINNKNALKNLKNLLFTCKRINDIIQGIANKFLYKNNIEVPERTNNLNCWFSCKYSVCTFCTKPVQKTFFTEKYTVCHSCRHLIEIISMTESKKSFKLSEEQLKDLNTEQVKNFYRRSTYVTLFLKRDVENLAYKVHGSKDKLKELKDKSAERSNKIQQNKLNVEERKRFIVKCLIDKCVSIKDIRDFGENNELFIKYIKTGVPKPEKKFQQFIEIIANNITKEKDIENQRNVSYYNSIKCSNCSKQGSIKCDNHMCKNCCKTCNYHYTLLLKRYF